MNEDNEDPSMNACRCIRDVYAGFYLASAVDTNATCVR